MPKYSLQWFINIYILGHYGGLAMMMLFTEILKVSGFSNTNWHLMSDKLFLNVCVVIECHFDVIYEVKGIN